MGIVGAGLVRPTLIAQIVRGSLIGVGASEGPRVLLRFSDGKVLRFADGKVLRFKG